MGSERMNKESKCAKSYKLQITRSSSTIYPLTSRLLLLLPPIFINDILVLFRTVHHVSTGPAEHFARVGADTKGIRGAVHVIDAEVTAPRLDDLDIFVPRRDGRRGRGSDEIWVGLLDRGVDELEIMEEIVGFFGARGDLDEPDADALDVGVESPDVFLAPAHSGLRDNLGEADRHLAFFAVEPVANRGVGGGCGVGVGVDATERGEGSRAV